MNKNYILKSGFLLFLVFSLSFFLVVFSIYYFKAEIRENDNLAIFINDEKVSDVPSKNSGYYFEKSECDDQTGNEVHIVWDNETWSPVISNMHHYPTRCNLYFTDKSFCERNPDTAGCVLLAKGNHDGWKFDDTIDKNLRYVDGSNPEFSNIIDIGEKYVTETYRLNFPLEYVVDPNIDTCANYYTSQGVFDYDVNMAFCEILEKSLSSISGDISSLLLVIYLANMSGVYDEQYKEIYDALYSYVGAEFPEEVLAEYDIFQTIEAGSPVMWHVNGVMNNVDDGLGVLATRLKVVRLGSYSWDTSPANINEGNGVNEWSQADLMKLLNPGYESESVGGSLWWNNQAGSCYNGSNNASTTCDFTNVSLENAKPYISDAVWYTWAVSLEDYLHAGNHSYVYERDNTTGKSCGSSLTTSNDDVERKMTWIGKLGLIYSSDYWYRDRFFETSSLPTIIPTYRDYTNSGVTMEVTASNISEIQETTTLANKASISYPSNSLFRCRC